MLHQGRLSCTSSGGTGHRACSCQATNLSTLGQRCRMVWLSRTGSTVMHTASCLQVRKLEFLMAEAKEKKGHALARSSILIDWGAAAFH